MHELTIKNFSLKRTLVIFILSFAIIQLNPSLSSAWTLTWDFEGGTVGQIADAGQPDGFAYAGTATRINGNVAHSGTKSVAGKWPSPTPEQGWGIVHGELLDEMDHTYDVGHGEELWWRSYIYIPANWRWNGDEHKKYMRMLVQSGNHAGLCYGGDRRGWYISNEVDEQTEDAESTWAILPKGEWVSVEVYWKVSYQSDGMIRAWQNGELIFEDTYSGGTIRNANDKLRLGRIWDTWNDGSPVVQTEYIDDIVMTTDRPANRDAQGNPMIGPDDWGSPPVEPPPVTLLPAKNLRIVN